MDSQPSCHPVSSLELSSIAQLRHPIPWKYTLLAPAPVCISLIRESTLPVDPTPGKTVQVSFQQGVNNYNGALDTYLNSEITKNHAVAKVLRVDGQTKTGHVQQALLRFDKLFGAATGQIDPNAEIKSASLQLKMTKPGDSLALHRMLSNWSAADTWNSLGNGIQTDGKEAASTPDVLTETISKGLQSFDVTASLQAWLANPSSNYGWAITPTGNDNVFFSSAEGSTAPRLVVEYVASSTSPTSPEPTPVGKTLIGAAGDDKLQGAAGNDTIRGLGGNDNLLGLGGNDRLEGYGGNDIINGGDGNDRISGAQGSDILTGGGGADTFVYNHSGHGLDTIIDFEVGLDKIDVSAILADAKYGSANTFADYIQVVGTGGGAQVQIDKLGDTGDQFNTLATLQGVDANSLKASHFIV